MPEFSARWHAFAREAAIAGHSLSAGLEALGKANYGTKGLYSHAFFGLSVGLERLLKLIVMIDYAVLNSASYPDNADLKRLGHDIERLYAEARRVHSRLPDPEDRYELPVGGLEDEIISFLSRFASTARYYNLDFLTAPNSQTGPLQDPVAEWSRTIGQQILLKHYKEKRRTADQQRAAATGSAMGPFTFVRFTAEDGTLLDSVEMAMQRTAENRVIQKFGTFYCASIARFAYMILYRPSARSAYCGG
ncbi:MAG: hypothetical protein A49_10480 [Methyloceanibacter sp.]|nr:MAG: hypothetical protein A49_10480 [Methyloceanibacter sp.]